MSRPLLQQREQEHKRELTRKLAPWLLPPEIRKNVANSANGQAAWLVTSPRPRWLHSRKQRFDWFLVAGWSKRSLSHGVLDILQPARRDQLSLLCFSARIAAASSRDKRLLV